jgi:TRAP-type C4-dicarboxylate transport system substrate-binding protein
MLMSNPNLIKAISAIFLVVFLLIAPHGAASKAVTIKIATLAPQGSAWMQTFNDLNAAVKKKTNNGVRFKIYPGGVLGDESDMRRKMHVGQIQGAALTSAGLSGIFSEIDVFQIPFLFESYDEIDYVLQKMDIFFKNKFADKGYILLGWSEGGFIRLMSTAPISSIDDLRKAKVWIWEDAPMAKAIFDAAKISAIPLSLPDVLVGLQTGLVDVVYAPPSGAISLQWFTRTKYITDLPLMYLTGGVVVKKKVFKKLSPAEQQTLLELCSKYLAELKLVIRRANQEAINVMKKHGVKLIKPSSTQIGNFKKIAVKAMEQQTGKSFSQKVRDEVIAHLKAFRKSKK